MKKKISLLVKPNARKESIQIQTTLDGEETYVVTVKEPPLDGKANTAVICALAKHFQVPKKAIKITSGTTARYKRCTIEK